MAVKLKIEWLVVNLILFLGAITANAQEETLYSLKWGIGILGLGSSEGYNFPKIPITLYDKPFGTKKYMLWQENEERVVFGPERGTIVGQVAHEDWIEVASEGFCLKYYQQRGKYALTLVHSSAEGYWISATELENTKFYLIDWMSFLLIQKMGYFPYAERPLVLREKPESKSPGVILLRDESYEINLTGKTAGLWGEAKVNWPRPGADESIPPKRRYQGWIKLLDDKGFPNIWYYTRD